MSLISLCPSFPHLAPEQQRAELDRLERSVPEVEVAHFWEQWENAGLAYAAPWNVRANVIGEGHFVGGEGCVNRVMMGGAGVRKATHAEVRILEKAIRSGTVQIEVHRGWGLLGPTGPWIVLHQATGSFRPFNYGGYQHPDLSAGLHQPYEHDEAQEKRWTEWNG